MLYIYTSKDNKNTVFDADLVFYLNLPDIVKRYESNERVLRVLREIDGMTETMGDYIIAKYGSVSLGDLSTGCKACMLAVLYNDRYVVSADEMGYNCIKVLAEISKEMDIKLYTSYAYSDFPDEVVVNVNGKEYCDKYDILDAIEEGLEDGK